ncbi:uncharacterized protein LOC111100512 isoform X2 [Crassostrea virginica]
MIRNVVRGCFRRPWSVPGVTVRGSHAYLDRSYRVMELNTLKEERPDKRKYLLEHFDCLQVDLTKHDKKTDPLAIHSDNFIHSSSQKPEIVIIGGMEERTFNMEMKAVMRRLGYNGFLEDVRRGKGTGVFIRNDKLKRKQHLPATVFSFTLRNPLF